MHVSRFGNNNNNEELFFFPLVGVRADQRIAVIGGLAGTPTTGKKGF
jgi:hypothetical protein